MKVVVAGQRTFGAAVLRSIYALPGIDIVHVLAPNIRDPMVASARSLQLRCGVTNVLDRRVTEGADLMVCAHTHLFVSKPLRFSMTHGAIGYHPSLLPRHRGRDAVEWAVRFGDPITGGTVYWLDDRVDGGDIFSQQWCWVRPDDDKHTLWRRELFPIGVRLLTNAVQQISMGLVRRLPQDEQMATWEPSVNPPPLARPDLPELEQHHG